MGRKLRTRLPTLQQNLMPQQPNHEIIQQSDKAAKAKYKVQYDRRHGARPLPALQPGDPVLVKLDHEKHWTKPGTVLLADSEKRTYQVATPSGTVRRNRKHLQAVPDPGLPVGGTSRPASAGTYTSPMKPPEPPAVSTTPGPPGSPSGTIATPPLRRSGRTIVRPLRFKDN